MGTLLSNRVPLQKIMIKESPMKHVTIDDMAVDFHRTNEDQSIIYDSQVLIANPHPVHASNEKVLAFARR